MAPPNARNLGVFPPRGPDKISLLIATFLGLYGSMVRKGSSVRVRERALSNRLVIGRFCSRRFLLRRVPERYGNFLETSRKTKVLLGGVGAVTSSSSVGLSGPVCVPFRRAS